MSSDSAEFSANMSTSESIIVKDVKFAGDKLKGHLDHPMREWNTKMYFTELKVWKLVDPARLLQYAKTFWSMSHRGRPTNGTCRHHGVLLRQLFPRPGTNCESQGLYKSGCFRHCTSLAMNAAMNAEVQYEGRRDGTTAGVEIGPNKAIYAMLSRCLALPDIH